MSQHSQDGSTRAWGDHVNDASSSRAVNSATLVVALWSLVFSLPLLLRTTSHAGVGATLCGMLLVSFVAGILTVVEGRKGTTLSPPLNHVTRQHSETALVVASSSALGSESRAEQSIRFHPDLILTATFESATQTMKRKRLQRVKISRRKVRKVLKFVPRASLARRFLKGRRSQSSSSTSASTFAHV